MAGVLKRLQHPTLVASHAVQHASFGPMAATCHDIHEITEYSVYAMSPAGYVHDVLRYISNAYLMCCAMYTSCL